MLARIVAVVALLQTGCLEARYVTQAAFGQLELMSDARPIAQVLADPSTDARTRRLLEEISHVRAFATTHGLRVGDRYQRFVDLDREAVVWFITASRPLAFEPKLWSFPVVGTFPYLGWFDLRDALAQRDRLRHSGWDVYVRPVRAYSTGGWFDDPVLSTMLRDGDDALPYLANVVLHELVHANVLIADQATFNESVASFVADEMAADYLSARYGASSPVVTDYRHDLAEDRRVGEHMLAAYRALDALYTSDATDDAKRAGKQRILSALAADLPLRDPPNNAMLLGFRTYNAGLAELRHLRASCDGDWPRLLAALRSVPDRAFGATQRDDIGPVIAALECPHAVR